MLNKNIVKYEGKLGILREATGSKDRKGCFVFQACDRDHYNSASDPLIDGVKVVDTTEEEQIQYLKRTFVWGKIEDVHTVGDYQIIEYTSKSDKRRSFHVYLNFRDTNVSYSSLDEALAGAIAYKYEGPNSRAAMYFVRMLDMDEKQAYDYGK